MRIGAKFDENYRKIPDICSIFNKNINMLDDFENFTDIFSFEGCKRVTTV